MALVSNTPPDAYTKPPLVAISNPNNETSYATNTLSLVFNVSVGESETAHSRLMYAIYYKADWQKDSFCILGPYLFNEGDFGFGNFSSAAYNLTLTGIPEGNHNLTIYAEETGAYGFPFMSVFFINGSSSIYFSIDTLPPSISLLSPQNKTYNTSEVPLNLATDTSITQMSYSLDGRENVTVTGNTTLTVLFNGAHNLTVYAQDEAGNIGASETITFTIAKPELFPTTWIIAVAIVVTVVVVAGLLFYVLKRKR